MWNLLVISLYPLPALASSGVGLKLNTTNNQSFLSGRSSYNSLIITLYDYSPEDKNLFKITTLNDDSTYEYQEKIANKRFNPLWVTAELIGAGIGGVTGFVVSAYVFAGIGLILAEEGGGFLGISVGIPVGLSFGSASGAWGMGKLGHQGGTFYGALIGGGIGAILGIIAWRTTQNEDNARMGDILLPVLPAIGATIGYNLSIPVQQKKD